MGNSGFRKLFFPGDFVETKYTNLYEMNVVDVDKNEIPLATYKNKVTLCTNIASLHKETPNQIESLKSLQEKYGSDQFQVLAFPSNQFANEPGNFKQIKQCFREVYKVNFPIFSKVFYHLIYSSNVKTSKIRLKSMEITQLLCSDF